MTSPAIAVLTTENDSSLSVPSLLGSSSRIEEPTNIDAAVMHFERVFARDHEGWAKFNFVDPAMPQKRNLKSVSLEAPDRTERLRSLLEQFIETHDCYMIYSVFMEAKRWNPEASGPKGRRGKMEVQSKTMVKYCRWAIAERDDFARGSDVPSATFTTCTSEGRYQDWYELDVPVCGATIEGINKRIAHGSGFGFDAIDCVHPLRLAGTRNRKRERRGEIVRVVCTSDTVFLPEDFQHLSLPPRHVVSMTKNSPLPLTGGTAAAERLWHDVQSAL